MKRQYKVEGWRTARQLPLLVAFVAALIVLAMDIAYVLAENRNTIEARHMTARIALENVKTRLERTMATALLAAQGMAALVRTKPNLTEADFEDMASSLINNRVGIRNIILVFGTVVKFVFPKQDNIKIIGYDYNNNSKLKASVLRVIETGVQEVDGPVQLLQGGVGVVVRVPVRMRGTDGIQYNKALINIPVDLETLLPEAKIKHPGDTFEIAVWKSDNTILLGQNEIFSKSPLLLDVSLPGVTWKIGAAPEMGWTQIQSSLLFIGALGIIFSVVIGVSIYLVLRAKLRIFALNRLYTLLSAINREIIGQQNREALFHNVCRIAVEVGGFRMAWVGIADGEYIIPVADINGLDYLIGIEISTNKSVQAQGPTGRAFHDGVLNICNDVANEPRMAPWRKKQLTAGYRASVGIPLRQNNHVIGVFTLYAGEPGFFDPEEAALLDEIGEDISHSLESIAQRGALDASQRLLQDVIDACDSAISLFSIDGDCLLANRRFCERLRRPLSEVLGEPRDTLWGDESVVIQYQYDRSVLSTGIVATYEEEEIVAGIPYFFLTVKFPVKSESGQIYGVGSISTDITSRKNAEITICSLNETLEKKVADRTLQLRETNADLESFCHSVSHDLKAPLRAISGFSEILLMRHLDGIDDKGRHYMDNIRLAAERMSKLIEELLTYARIGRGAVQSVPVPLEIILEKISIIFADRIGPATGKLEIQHPLAVPIADPRLLEQVLTNIIDNAIKYHQPDSLPLITLSSSQKDGSTFIRISDNGIGIEPQFHEKIFDVFQRLHTESEYPGTGIGLAIVRKGMRLMGGDVSVESTPGQGSSFAIRLPHKPVGRDLL